MERWRSQSFRNVHGIFRSFLATKLFTNGLMVYLFPFLLPPIRDIISRSLGEGNRYSEKYDENCSTSMKKKRRLSKHAASTFTFKAVRSGSCVRYCVIYICTWKVQMASFCSILGMYICVTRHSGYST